MTYPGQQHHHRGTHGQALRLPIPDIPEAGQSVDHWLLTAPSYHPLWSQYVMAVVRLDDVPGFPAPKRQFDDATHELLVVALNPHAGPQTAATMAEHARTGAMPYLTPINYADQFTATDEEMRQLASWAAWGVVNGVLNPETADAPALLREAWLTSMVKTLAHIRGEVHAP